MVVVKCNDALWSLDHLLDGGDGERALLFTRDFFEDSSELVILLHSARVSRVKFLLKASICLRLRLRQALMLIFCYVSDKVAMWKNNSKMKYGLYTALRGT